MELYDDTGNGIAFAIERVADPEPGQAWGQRRAIMVHAAGREPTFYIPQRETPQKDDH